METDKQKTILVIDDEEIFLRSLTCYLEDMGYTILTSGNGRDGLKSIQQNTVDLVLVDLRMPEMGGFDVVTFISSNFPAIPIIVLSGTNVETDPKEALARGAWDFLHKPIHDEKLLNKAIESALHQSQPT